MAKKKTEEKPETKWKDRLLRCKKFQEGAQAADNWQRNANLLFGTNPDNREANDVAYGWGLAKTLETSIYVSNPDFMLEARDPSQQEVARLLGEVVRYDTDQMDLKGTGNIGILDDFVAGYLAVIEVVETEKSYANDPDAEGVQVPRVDKQCYNVRRIHYNDILFDPKGLKTDLSDHRYLFLAWYPTIQELKDDERFKGSLPEDIEDFPEVSQGTRTSKKQPYESSTRGRSTAETDPEFKTICVWEIWDKVNQKVIYLTDHRHIEIGEIDWPFKLQIGPRSLFPVTLMAFNPSNLGFYPKPELSLIAPQLVILNKLDRRMYTDLLTKWRKWAVPGELISTEQAGKLTDNTIENAIITVDKDALGELAGIAQGGQADLTKLVVPFADPAPEADVIQGREIIKAEMGEIIGYGPPERGGLPKTRSAREAVAIKERLDQRLSKRADAIADFFAEVCRKHILILQQTMEIERYVRVVPGVDGLARWRSYSKDDIQGDFEFIVYAGTSAPRTTESKRASELELFRALAPILQAGGLPVEPLFLRLAEAYQWKGIDQFFKNYKDAGKQVAAMLAQMSQGAVPPDAFLNAVSQLVGAILRPQEIQQIGEAVMTGKPALGAPAGKPGGQRGDQAPGRTTAGTM